MLLRGKGGKAEGRLQERRGVRPSANTAKATLADMRALSDVNCHGGSFGVYILIIFRLISSIGRWWWGLKGC